MLTYLVMKTLFFSRLTAVLTAVFALLLGFSVESWAIDILKSEAVEADDAEEPCQPACSRPLDNPNIPHLISPRRTLIAAGSFLVIRWNAVENATQYTVLLQGADGTHWEQNVTTNQAIYDGMQLQPGRRYVVTVNANNGEQVSEANFRVLTETEYETLRQRLEQVSAAATDDRERVLAQARVYRQERVHAAAIELLQEAIADAPDEAEFYCELEAVYETATPGILGLDFYDTLQRERMELTPDCS